VAFRGDGGWVIDSQAKEFPVPYVLVYQGKTVHEHNPAFHDHGLAGQGYDPCRPAIDVQDKFARLDVFPRQVTAEKHLPGKKGGRVFHAGDPVQGEELDQYQDRDNPQKNGEEDGEYKARGPVPETGNDLLYIPGLEPGMESGDEGYGGQEKEKGSGNQDGRGGGVQDDRKGPQCHHRVQEDQEEIVVGRSVVEFTRAGKKEREKGRHPGMACSGNGAQESWILHGETSSYGLTVTSAVKSFTPEMGIVIDC
jgi:hypothetical protein